MKNSRMERQRKRTDKPMKTFAVMNQKGGVGKTTTVVNLAAAMGDLGYKVLVIDFDPQGNCSSGLGVDGESSTSIYDVMAGRAEAAEAVQPSVSAGVYIIPSNVQLAGAEIELATTERREFVLRDCLADLKDRFDYVFIDCPPSLGLLTVNALVAANSLLIPIQCEYYALEGVSKLVESMRMVKSNLNPELDIFGIVMTMYDVRTTLSRQVVDEVRRHFGKLVFRTAIPRSVKVSEAPSHGIPVTMYARVNKGAIAYRNLAKEVIRRG